MPRPRTQAPREPRRPAPGEILHGRRNPSTERRGVTEPAPPRSGRPKSGCNTCIGFPPAVSVRPARDISAGILHWGDWSRQTARAPPARPEGRLAAGRRPPGSWRAVQGFERVTTGVRPALYPRPRRTGRARARGRAAPPRAQGTRPVVRRRVPARARERGRPRLPDGRRPVARPRVPARTGLRGRDVRRGDRLPLPARRQRRERFVAIDARFDASDARLSRYRWSGGSTRSNSGCRASSSGSPACSSRRCAPS